MNIAKRDTSEEILDAFIKIAPYLNELIQDDITIGIYDTNKLLLNIPGKTFALNVQKGDPLLPGDIVTNALRENRNKSALVPKELFGFPLIARAIPLQDETGKVIGGVGVGTSLEKSNDLFVVAESLSAIVEETAASLDDIASSVTKLAGQVESASDVISQVTAGASEIGKISTVVRGISDQINLLGLNAAIEAARAGDHGRGFSVVSNEIRKLAANSKENVSQIDHVTKSISNSIMELNESFAAINEVTTNQAATIQEISATVQEISRNAHNLSKMADSTRSVK
ncbi:methyl-accepting chemotaxis protein [Sporosarcina siberiensis]|uniref:Methyl-accepting chemotaxis protein n=1 Tax=Sporosarcina siberiensis TaxID=1365606 RepID=A0ABW4SFD9_9BACL